MNWQTITSLLSVLSVIAVAVAEVFGARRLTAAKDAQIEALKQQIESLKEMTPMKVREYFISTKEQLEAYNNELKSQLETAKTQLQEMENQRQFALHPEAEELAIKKKKELLLKDILELSTRQKQVSAHEQLLIDIVETPEFITPLREVEESNKLGTRAFWLLRHHANALLNKRPETDLSPIGERISQEEADEVKD